MKVLELFAGTRSIGKAFEKKGHEVFSVEWDKKHKDIDLYCDIGQLTAKEVLEKFGRPDVVWESPDCCSYSVAAISHHRDGVRPKTDYARFCDSVNAHTLELIKELAPKYWFIENPAGMLQHMPFLIDFMRGGGENIYLRTASIQTRSTMRTGTSIFHGRSAPTYSRTTRTRASFLLARTGTNATRPHREEARPARKDSRTPWREAAFQSVSVTTLWTYAKRRLR